MERGWDKNTQFLVDWFLANQSSMPVPPFQLDTARRVIGPRFYAMIKIDIAKGPSGPKSMYGALLETLFLLYKVAEKQKEDSSEV